MVKRHFKEVKREEVHQIVKTKKSKWCFSNINQISNLSNALTLKTYANYKIFNNKIQHQTLRPKILSLGELQIPIDDKSVLNKNDKCISIIENTSKSVGQIFVLFKKFGANSEIIFYFGSFFVIEQDNQLIGVTALHCLQGGIENGGKILFHIFF